jgi:hypothetical protein
MKTFAFKLILSALIVIGGFDGSGGRLSPYSSSDKVTAKLVKEFRAASSKKRIAFLEPLPVSAPKTVLLAWIKPGDTSQPIETLTGMDSSGKKQQIDMAVLSQLKVVSINAERHTLTAEVELFPMITPDELVKKQPTYRQLWSDYRKTIQLGIETVDSKGRILSLIDAGTPGSPGLAISSLAADTVVVVLPHKKIKIDRASLWWAIPSVMDDPQYPYRFETGA